MRPIGELGVITAYQLLTVGKDGKFYAETANITEPGDYGSGFYSNIKTAQYQQTILALKGIKTHVFEIEWVL